MFEMFNGLLNIEGQVRNTIIGTLEDLSEELNEPDFKNFSVTIQPINEKFEFICLVYHKRDGKLNFVREITLKEILS
jgi:hypothetical protein